jgi:hypothetical protein
VASASKVALDMLHWEMRSALHRRIVMAIEMARKVCAFYSVVDFMSCINLAKRPWYGQLKIKPSYCIVGYCVFS